MEVRKVFTLVGIQATTGIDEYDTPRTLEQDYGAMSDAIAWLVDTSGITLHSVSFSVVLLPSRTADRTADDRYIAATLLYSGEITESPEDGDGPANPYGNPYWTPVFL